ncbi:MAG: hypothetical protein ACR2NU_05030, partial [Aeoliella sp.]
MSVPQGSAKAYATEAMLDLAPESGRVDGVDDVSRRIELVADAPESLTSASTSLLHARLRAVTILMLIVFSMVLVWALLSEGAGGLGTMHIYRNTGLVRLVILAGILAVLSMSEFRSQFFLRGIEYFLFGSLTLLWIIARYEALYIDANTGNITELMLDGRTSMIGLFLLMVVHGIFIPHRWLDTAQTVLTMALAPVLVLVLFEIFHPELVKQTATVLTWQYVGTNVLVVLVGAVLAIYASYVLHALRKEVHDAKQYGQYRLASKLGSGGMGDVYLAEH